MSTSMASPQSGWTFKPPPEPPPDLISAEMMASLAETRPWVRLCASVGFVVSALMALVGVGVVIFGSSAASDGAAGIPMTLFGVIYVAAAMLYIAPALYLYRYAKAIEKAMKSIRKAPAVTEALAHQKAFWKFVGVLTAIGIAVNILVLVVAIGIPLLIGGS